MQTGLVSSPCHTSSRSPEPEDVTEQALADKHEAQLNSVREAAEIQRKQEQRAIEERKNAHIQARLGGLQPPSGQS